MITLQSIKTILKVMGLYSNDDGQFNHNLINYLPNIIYSIPLLSLLFPLIAYFCKNVGNLSNATDVFYVIAATLLCIGQYWFMMLQKVPLMHLLCELQQLVDKSII